MMLEKLGFVKDCVLNGNIVSRSDQHSDTRENFVHFGAPSALISRLPAPGQV